VDAFGGITTILEDGDLMIGGAFGVKRLINCAPPIENPRCLTPNHLHFVMRPAGTKIWRAGCIGCSRLVRCYRCKHQTSGRLNEGGRASK
jgi:hypothetical protein